MVQVWDRVVRGPARGTVRFHGTVPQSPDGGVYAGVEWDDPEAGGGKYDGEIFGTRYFEAPAKSSSFLKVEKVEQGRELADVLRRRYSLADAAVEAATIKEMERKKNGEKRGGGLCHIVAGAALKTDADGAFKRMTNVTASGLPVGVCGDLRRWFPNITDLNLSHTLLARWASVVDVLDNLPRLQSLVLSHNKFEPYEMAAMRPLVRGSSHGSAGGAAAEAEGSSDGDVDTLRAAPPSKTYPSVRTLALTHTNFSWGGVRFLLSLLPGLTELNASDNGFAAAPLAASEAPSLRTLRLDRTQVASWEALSGDLQHAGALEALHLSGTPLAVVGPSGNGAASPPSPRVDEDEERNGDRRTAAARPSEPWKLLAGRLKGLFLRHTQVRGWESVEAIATLGVQALCLTDTPLTDAMTEHERRCLLIAMIPALRTLNRSGVTESERIEAERFYIRYHYGKPHPPPRVAALKEIHGELLPLAEIDMAPKLTADVTVRYLARPAGVGSGTHNTDGHPAPETPATLNVYDTVSKLLSSVCNPVGLLPSECHLVRVDPEVEGTPLERCEMDLPHRKLYTYRVKDGDVIEVVQRQTGHRDPHADA